MKKIVHHIYPQLYIYFNRNKFYLIDMIYMDKNFFQYVMNLKSWIH